MPLLRMLRYLIAAALLLPLASVAGAQSEKKPPGCLTGEVPDPKGTGKCVKQVVCGPDQVVVLNKCFAKCPDGMTMDNQGKCQGCPTGQVQDPKTGKCAKQVVCGPDQVAVLNKCFTKCPDGMTMDNRGKCQGCPTGQEQEPKTGKCVAQKVCAAGQELILGKCLTKCPDGSKRDSRGGCVKAAPAP